MQPTLPDDEWDNDPAWIDIGDGHSIRFYGWHPNRALNPQYADLPDVDRAGMIVRHPDHLGQLRYCDGGVTFDRDATRGVFNGARWTVVQEEPLTLSPSLLCTRCGDHGFIRDGKWVTA